MLSALSVGLAVNSSSCGFHFGNGCFNIWTLLSLTVALFSLIIALVIIFKTFRLSLCLIRIMLNH